MKFILRKYLANYLKSHGQQKLLEDIVDNSF